ncbi:hypothetical protein PybrP1_012552 [[Pythium] brassicae (nom. inval.)]|nr:hypothetical protein PybrP1_012552 [[Pythium] brassicae (nom. inval.)]
MDPQAKELSALVRHVPRIVVSRFAKKPERLRGPESASFTAVLALFDISGFSSLGSRLSEDERSRINTKSRSSEGSTGREVDSLGVMPKDLMAQRRKIETLTKTLNKTLEPVIDVILQHGGDIIKFAGDAIIALWETEASSGKVTPPGHLTYSAARCALEALHVLETISVSNGSLATLGMHVGIGVSKVTGNHVGGVLNRWEFYLGGDANRQISVAEQDAAKGQIVLSREAHGALLDSRELLCIDVETASTTNENQVVLSVSESLVYLPKWQPVVRATKAQIPFLRGYVPGTISSYLQKGLVINPCTRNVTVVFIKLEGVKEIEDPAEQLEQVHKYLCRIQESAYKVQGTLRQFVIDDKGAVAIVVIGLPPFYHENNALRGVKLASYLLAKDIPASIGRVRAEYAVVGDVINLAARLMSAASVGEILCDEKTREETSSSIEYQDAREMAVKGKAALVQVFAVRIEQTESSLEANALLDSMHALPYGSETVAENVPLLTSTVERVPVLEYLVHKGRISRSMIPILNDLLPYDQLCRGSFSAFDKGEERSKALEHIIFSIVEGLSARKPILLVFDNAQWMDGLSCSLLLKVLEELPNVSCLIATRSHSRTVSQSLLELVEQLPYTKRLEMRCFSYQVTSLFLCQHYHIAIMDSQVLDFVYARTDGNPAELLKLMEFMLASKCIRVDRAAGSVAILADLDDLDMQVPQYTRARVMSCVDTLDGLAQLAIKVVSVNPEPVEERTVYRILASFLRSERNNDSHDDVGGLRLQTPPSDAALSIQTQVRIGLAECEREAIVTIDGRKKVLFFNSEEMRLVVYDTMLPSQRELLHGYYAQWLREVTVDESGLSVHRLPTIASGTSVVSATESAVAAVGRRYQQLAMLGHHLSRSGEEKAALEVYLKAAEHAIEAHELAFATDCMQSAFKLLGDQPRTKKLNDLDHILLRSRVEFMRGAIAVEKSEWDAATTHMTYIIRLCQRKGSVLRRYSSSVHHDGMFDPPKKSSSVFFSSIMPSSSVLDPRRPSTFLSATGLQRLDPTDSRWFIEMHERCMPHVANLRLLTSRLASSTSRLLDKARRQNRGPGRLGAGSSRVQPEAETLLALHQLNFYRRKAEVLVQKIHHAKRKQEAMSREIQKLTQRSLQTKQKR